MDAGGSWEFSEDTVINAKDLSKMPKVEKNKRDKANKKYEEYRKTHN